MAVTSPTNQCSYTHRQIARCFHRLYKSLLSPLFGSACRFHPSCSDYALEAIEKHGWICGGWHAFCRLVRCHPWSPGGPDPVP